MKKLLILALLTLARASAHAGTYYLLSQDASSATVRVGGAIRVGSTTALSPTIILDGMSGSVTANNFQGSGAQLTGIPSTASIVGIYVKKIGDSMSGSLTLVASTLTVQGIAGIGTTGQTSNGTLVIQSTSTTASTPVIDVLNNGGTELFRTQQDGKTGINKAVPLQTLHVGGSAEVDGNVLINAGSSGMANAATTEGFLFTSNAAGGDVYVQVASADKIHVKNGGNVGINTANPGTQLDVNGGATVRGQETITSTLTVQGGSLLVGGSTFTSVGGNLGLNNLVPSTTLDIGGNAQWGSGATKSTMTAAGTLVMGSTITVGPTSYSVVADYTKPILGSLSLLNANGPSAAASVAFSGFKSTDVVECLLQLIVGSTGGIFRGKINNSGGAAYFEGQNACGDNANTCVGLASGAGTPDSSFFLSRNMSVDPSSLANGRVRITPGAIGVSSATWHSEFEYVSSGVTYSASGGGRYWESGSVPFNGVTFLITSGSFSGGIWCYAWKPGMAP